MGRVQSGGRLGAKAEDEITNAPMKEFKPCNQERVLGYAKETNKPSMFEVKVPGNSR